MLVFLFITCMGSRNALIKINARPIVLLAGESVPGFTCTITFLKE